MRLNKFMREFVFMRLFMHESGGYNAGCSRRRTGRERGENKASLEK